MKFKTREEIIKEKLAKYRKELGIGSMWVDRYPPYRKMVLDEVFHDLRDDIIKLRLHIVGNKKDIYVYHLWDVMNGNIVGVD